MEGLELISLRIISAVGTARSMFVEAIKLAREGKFTEAEEKIKEGDKCFLEGHIVHTELLSRQANGEEIPFDLILVHAEDQMMSAEGFKIVAEELIDLYKRIF